MIQDDDDDAEPELASVIDNAMEALLRRAPRAMPAKVVKWDATKQRANCQVLVKVPYLDEQGDRQVESVAVIPGVPIMFPGSGGFRLTCPISDGTLSIEGSTVPATTGLLIWADRSLDKWLSGSGKEVDPEADHQAGLQDAVFIPGLNPFGAPLDHVPTETMTIGSDSDDNGRIAFQKSEIQLGEGATKEVSRKGDGITQGSLVIAHVPASGVFVTPCSLVVTYNPGGQGGSPTVVTNSGTITLDEDIAEGSAHVKAVD